MSHYTNISLDQMRDFLKPDKGWKLNNTQHKEVVFDFNIPSKPFLLVRVYSGIKSDTQISRGCGKDAIRVCAVNLARNKGWIKAKRVHRVEGWKENLKNRVLLVIDEAKKRLEDPEKNY
jgi:predicted protein tyrosine phosphatase